MKNEERPIRPIAPGVICKCEEEGSFCSMHGAVDIHRETASKVLEISSETVTEHQRKAGRTINFGTLFGAGRGKS